MTAASDGVGGVLLGVGGLIFLFRLGYLCVRNEGWNVDPNILPWGVTIMVSGFTTLCVAAFSPVTCSNGCLRSEESAQSGWVGAGVILLLVGGCMVPCRCRGENACQSGFDITLIGMGLTVIVVDASLGTCPPRC